jgi:CRP-like cAMP-binding protein
LLVIDRDAFRDTLQANPDVADRLSETLAQRRRELDAALATKEEAPPEGEERRILDRIRSLFGF